MAKAPAQAPPFAARHGRSGVQELLGAGPALEAALAVRGVNSLHPPDTPEIQGRRRSRLPGS